MMPKKLFIISMLSIFVSLYTFAADKNLSRDLASLKHDVLQLNKDLKLLEEELLYPSTQLAVLLSIDVGTPVRLVDINLTLDNKHVGYHFYAEEEFAALAKGAVHRVYDGNITSGNHQIKVTITGYDPQGKDYQKTTHYPFVKHSGKKFIELKVVDDSENLSHKFEFNEWEQ